jgi:transcriptional regulator with XRE-family HTH domain
LLEGFRLGLDYGEIGKRIAKRRKALNLTQAAVAERCDISDQYLSNIERAVSIPSTEVIMRLAIALDTTPDEFLVGTVRQEDERWKNVAQRLRGMDARQLDLADSFLTWLSDQKL